MIQKTINPDHFASPQQCVHYFIKRASLFKDVLNYLSKKDIINVNKWIHKATKNSIFEMINKGGRMHADTYDWRNDKDFLAKIIFNYSEFPLLLIRALIFMRGNKLEIPDQFTDAEIIELGYKAPEAVLLMMAFADKREASKEETDSEELKEKFDGIDYESLVFLKGYLESINLINQGFIKHRIFIPISSLTYEQFYSDGLGYLASFRKHPLFPHDLKKPLEELLQIIEESKENETSIIDSDALDDIEDVPSNTTEEEKNTMTNSNSEKFLGYIRLQKSFYNFYPVAKVIQGQIVPIANSVMRERFPSFGSFSLVKDYYKDNVTRTLIDNYFYTVEVEQGDLILYRNIDGTYREDYKYCIVGFHALVREQRFEAIDSERYFLVVYPTQENPNLQGSIYVSFNRDGDPDPTATYQRIPVVLALNGQYIGPTPLLQDSNGLNYVNFRSGINDGVMNCFKGDYIQEAVYSHSIFAHEENDWCARDILDTNHRCVTKGFFDLLDDNALLQRMAEQSKQFDKKTLPQIRDWLKETTLNKDLLGPNDQIRAERKDRLAKFLSNLQLNEGNVDTFVKVVSNSMALAKNDQSGFFDELVKRIVAKPDALEHIKEFKLIHDQLEVLEQQREHEEKELKKVTESIAKLNAEKDKLQKKKLEGELAKITEETEKQKAKLEEVLKALGQVDDLKAIEKEVKRLDDRRRELQHNNTILEEEGRDVERHLLNEVSNRKIKELAFTPALAHKFSEAAAQWLKEEESDKLKTKLDAVNALEADKLTGERLVEYLYKQTKRYRAYDRNTILNLYICLAQNLLTVFSGRPGCGKTSICHIMANVLGSTSIEARAQTEDVNRFLPVAVERGWTSKRDFLGYFNPLTKHFETPDPRRYSAVQMLDAEEKAGVAKFPYIVLLDEANLSPMEYYWADFMNAGLDVGSMNTLSLGDGSLYRIPATLRFVATINNDQTTESLSPRLIDRSWIVTLPEPTWEGLTQVADVPEAGADCWKIVDWSALQKVFSYNACAKELEKYEEKVNAILTAVYKSMSQMGLNPSPRTQKAILAYVAAASKWFEKEADQAFTFNTAIDYAVSQKLLPSINLVGEKYAERLNDLQNILETNDLTRSAQMLQAMIDRGNASMNLYSFF